MLVLSRRQNEKVLFPTINASVQVVTIKQGVVRLGIEAPPELPVFREEVLGPAEKAELLEASQRPDTATAQLHELNHLLRNRLNAATLGLALLRRQIKAGLTKASEVTLQKIDEEFQMLRQQAQTAADKACGRPVPQARRALLVEDDRNERELLAGFLRMAGLDVITAGDGTDALDYLREQAQPDVVLLDMVLPRCDGPTTVREIRRNPALAGVKIFAMTGHSPERFNLNCESARIDRWFNKPLDPEALLRDLHQEFGDMA